MAITLFLHGASSSNTVAQNSGSFSCIGTVTVTGASTIIFDDHRSKGTTILHRPITISSISFRLDGGRTLRNKNTLVPSFPDLVNPETSAVPRPLPFLGAAACFGYSRKPKERINGRTLSGNKGSDPN
ncbi:MULTISPECIES: hypothetical protein [unclassified Cyanobium]|uniref:hypothetical protein n=1 Tax=unclassified Cyanobium TaxID=2627006 RepID=UPI0020CDDFA2|nr:MULTISPECIES: hypothetical protein [unclassified Cyanobium]MCP9834934.1 hypothetical protein [Cyanobium sp. La Preciosa 7G6]MCP9937697.1 hypothetical protein [Cyanobium sp. Aljojuca 7A6]